jgi:hypothetical protein
LAYDLAKAMPPGFSRLNVYRSHQFPVGAGKPTEVSADMLSSWQPPGPSVVCDLMPGDDFEGEFRVVVVVCRDELEHKYRFRVREPAWDDVKDRGALLDTWTPGEPEPPWTDGW